MQRIRVVHSLVGDGAKYLGCPVSHYKKKCAASRIVAFGTDERESHKKIPRLAFLRMIDNEILSTVSPQAASSLRSKGS
jgi:hypothetical protein